MIQEKDFLYRVPVKTAPITTPGGQIRNPEILVDVEGGEFMHGNILDANSTNKLINQSVDDKITEGGYVTKNLLDAETARATAKENQIKAQVDIINGDSTTEGSFRKAIADVVAAAPEDLDTLKEIADKLAGNDDLHTALNQAITEKADASALLNEVTRATGAESGLQAAIATKADATALSNYVLTTALNQQVDTLNTAISAKQDAGNYIPYESINNKIYVTKHGEGISFESDSGNASIKGGTIVVGNTNGHIAVTPSFIWLKGHNDNGEGTDTPLFQLNEDGLRLRNGDNNYVLTSNASTIDITEYAKKSEIAPLPTNIVTASAVSDRYFGFEKSIEIYSEAINKIMTIGYTGINFQTNKNDVAINEDGFFISSDSDDTDLCSFTTSGIKFAGKTSTDIPTANGTFINITEQIDNTVNDYNFISQQQADSRYALADTFSSLSAGLSAKQNKITVNSVDVTDIETADAEKLRTIVTNLTNALSESGLIRLVKNVE